MLLQKSYSNSITSYGQKFGQVSDMDRQTASVIPIRFDLCLFYKVWSSFYGNLSKIFLLPGVDRSVLAEYTRRQANHLTRCPQTISWVNSRVQTWVTLVRGPVINHWAIQTAYSHILGYPWQIHSSLANVVKCKRVPDNGTVSASTTWGSKKVLGIILPKEIHIIYINWLFSSPCSSEP